MISVGNSGRPNNKPKLCSLPKKSGPCEAAFPMWYHNKKSGSCQKFIFGGCQGNKNSFDTREECEEVCRVTKSASTGNNVSQAFRNYNYNYCCVLEN